MFGVVFLFFLGGGGGELSLKNCVDFILNSEINFILYIEFKKESQFYTKLNNYFDFTVDFFILNYLQTELTLY